MTSSSDVPDPHADDLEQILRDDDRVEFPGRLKRYKEIDEWLSAASEGLALGPDFEAGLAFSEARFAYVNGLWLSAILMSVTAVERHLAMRLEKIGLKNIERTQLKELVGSAVTAGMLTKSEALKFDELRIIRNAYAHFRKDSRYLQMLLAQREHQQALWEMSREENSIEGVDVNLVLSVDAKMAVMLASAYFLEACRGHFSFMGAEGGE